MRKYSLKRRTYMFLYVIKYWFLSFARKILLDTELDALKPTSKQVVHKTFKFLGNKIADPANSTKLWK